MSQLVNSRCALCDEVISSIIDGHICESCNAPVHKWCAKPADPDVDRSHCYVCGADRAVGAAREKSVDRRPVADSPEESRTVGDHVVSAVRFFRLVRFSLGGVAAIALGLFLLFIPGLRDNPNKLTLSEALPGIAAIGAGLGCFALVVFFWRRG
jgi:hypothetical protein